MDSLQTLYKVYTGEGDDGHSSPTVALTMVMMMIAALPLCDLFLRSSTAEMPRAKQDHCAVAVVTFIQCWLVVLLASDH